MKIIYLFVICFVITVTKATIGHPNCGGTKIGNYLFSPKKTTFEDAKLCCSIFNMEIYDVLDKADMKNFANVVSPLKKRNHKFQITFWVNGGVTADELRLQLCPTIVWSSSSQGESTFSFKTEKCVMHHVYVCRVLETTGAGNDNPEVSGTTLKLPKLAMEERRASTDIAKNKPCHLVPLKYGLYMSSEKMDFNDARSCCLRKGLNVPSQIWSGSKNADLKIAITSSFHNLSKEALWFTPFDKSCFALAIGNDKVSASPVSCFEANHAFCENRDFNPSMCQRMQFLPLKTDSHVISDTQATHMQAEACCLQQGKYLVSFATDEQSREFYSEFAKNGMLNSTLPATIFWTAGRRSLASRLFPSERTSFKYGLTQEFCLSAVAILGKEGLLLTDVACEQRLHFVCTALPGEISERKSQDLNSVRRKKSSAYPQRMHSYNNRF